MKAKTLVEISGCSVPAACQVVGLARSCYYYESQRSEAEQLVADLEQEAGRHPQYGSRRLTYQLRRPPYPYPVNRKRTQRLMRQRNLVRRLKLTKCRTTNSQHAYPRYPNLVRDVQVDHPEQLWVCDLTYVRLGNGIVYLAVIMDVFKRRFTEKEVEDIAGCVNKLKSQQEGGFSNEENFSCCSGFVSNLNGRFCSISPD